LLRRVNLVSVQRLTSSLPLFFSSPYNFWPRQMLRFATDECGWVQSATDVASFTYIDVSPRPSSSQKIHQFEELVYWVKLQVQSGSDPTKFVVEVYKARFK